MTADTMNGVKADINSLRNTTQFIIPEKKTIHQGYDIYPAFKIEGPIYNDFASLSEWIINQKKKHCY
ncbi:hypothetical protein [Pedobacter lusitanus]|uniref:hypothetical protein n=1 Tax=Pedobacter lusitanus TaxID=1503925 RepID=UPI000B1CC2FA|nr:hypothetical protein [Pedobacter lusitanus]